MDMKRFLPLSGVAFVVLLVLAILIIGDTPASDASGEKVMSYYEGHQAGQFIGAFVFAASVPFLVIFASSLAAAFSPAEAGRRPVGEFVLVGGSLLAGALFLVTAVVGFALADGADQGVSGDALQALNVLNSDTWVGFNAGLGVMMLGAAGLLNPRVRTYRWLGWAALVLGVALFIPFVDFLALLLSGVWIIVTSVVLFRERREATETVAPHLA
jgi:hypothetical protein